MLRDLAYLFFPTCCAACESPLHKNEKTICISCRHRLPLGNYHNVNAEKIKKVFSGRAKLQNATSLFIFHKDSLVQNLIHNLKYKNRQDVSKELGIWLGEELSLLTNYKGIDVVIPVPLHKKRRKERGYNQVEKFGVEISKKINATYINNVLTKNSYNKKQSKHTKLSRWENTESVFGIQNEHILENKHLLLVDDIITTGATIESCIEVLKKIPGVKISVAAMAITI